MITCPYCGRFLYTLLGLQDHMEDCKGIKEHHIWCNKFMGPREDCKMCQDLFQRYPYSGMTPDEMLAKYFPSVQKVR